MDYLWFFSPPSGSASPGSCSPPCWRSCCWPCASAAAARGADWWPRGSRCFRNTPLLVQLLFWYFAAWNLLPLAVKEVVNDEHAWSILPGNVWWLTPEFLCSMWGLGVFTSAFLVEEIASGLRAVSHGQREAALSQGFTPWQELRFILLPQGLANAWQPIVGQYLNLMKLSSLASGIGFAELTYQVRQIESYNAHALEAFAVGTALYLALGVAMGVALTRLGPGRKLQRSAQHER
ncbi:glutamate Aspartate transport system permease protein GltJ [Klebsiella aerogenes]|nr:glutamate Aspartate transport system permease protein GltJ [Klebsiella aerogenes]